MLKMERKTMTITLSLHDIQQQIHQHSYYIGNARRESGTPTRTAATIHTSADDRRQLENHIHTAISEITQLINRYMSECRQTSEEDEANEGYTIVRLHYRAPYNFPAEANKQMEELITRYTVQRTLHQWLQQIKPDESIIVATEVEKTTLQIRQAMAVRIRPRRKRKDPDTKIAI
jgi:hypothetical protein